MTPIQDDLPAELFDPNICECDFSPYDEVAYWPDGTVMESWHYKRRCYACGVIFWSLHCRCEQPQRSCGCNRRVIPVKGKSKL